MNNIFGIFHLAIVVIWIVVFGALGYRIFLALRGRRRQRSIVTHLRTVQGEDFDPDEHPEPKPIFQAILTSKEFWRTLFWAFTTAGFMMFIVEETMQIRGFGRYGLQQGRLWEEAAKASNYSVSALKRDRFVINALTILNPPAGYVFSRYCDAEEKKLGWEMTRIESELKKLDSRVTLIENELRIRPIGLPENINISARPVAMPIEAAKAALSYPRQIDYQTKADRDQVNKNFVYVTAFGRKFHRSACRSVVGREGVRKITREEALSEDKTPCLRCKP